MEIAGRKMFIFRVSVKSVYSDDTEIVSREKHLNMPNKFCKNNLY